MDAKAPITQCTKLVNDKRCILVSSHRGLCVEPIPRTDMSDVIRYRVMSDKHAEAQEKIEVLETLVEIAMDTLDWISTTTEGTPKEPFLSIHRRAGVAMRAINIAGAAKGTRAVEERLHAVDVWVHMHATVDHACGECRALLRATADQALKDIKHEA
jgi:hypothetical protein